jgi:hypothetical protein
MPRIRIKPRFGVKVIISGPTRSSSKTLSASQNAAFSRYLKTRPNNLKVQQQVRGLDDQFLNILNNDEWQRRDLERDEDVIPGKVSTGSFDHVQSTLLEDTNRL